MNVQELLADITDHARGMWRFRWHGLIVAWVVAILGWTFVYRMPDIYEASARVSVDTNSLLPDLTRGLTASENLMSEVDLVSQALLARPNLAEVARETDLDLRADTPEQMENLITGLQGRVTVRGGRDNIFSISFQDRDREKASEVVSALLNTFMESSLGAQGDDADMTERAIALEIEDHEQRLLKAEADLADFKKRNLGFMPDDGEDYYTRLQSSLAGVSETERQIRLLRQRINELNRQIEGEEPVFGLMAQTPTQSTAGCSQAGNLAAMKAELTSLQARFTDKYPRIVTLKESIASIEEQCGQEAGALAGGAATPTPGNSLDTNPVYQNLRLQLSNARVELAALQEELSSRQRQVTQLRANVDKIAEVETEMKRLNRDYNVIEDRHQELLRRWETLQSKKRLDPVTDQVQFNVLEPPFASATPVAPNRFMLLLAVVIFSVGAGAVIAFGLNQIKPVFFTRRSVARAAGIPVLGSVTMIMSSEQVRARHRRLAAWLAGNVALFAMAGTVIIFEEPISELLGKIIGGGAL